MYCQKSEINIFITHSQIEAMVHNIATEQKETSERLTPLDMFKHGQLVKTLVLFFAWITVCMTAYTLGLNATHLSGHIALNFLLSRITALPMTVIMYFTVNRFGRVKTLGSSHITMGIFCLYLSGVCKDEKVLVVVIYFLANMFVGLSKFC